MVSKLRVEGDACRLDRSLWKMILQSFPYFKEIGNFSREHAHAHTYREKHANSKQKLHFYHSPCSRGAPSAGSQRLHLLIRRAHSIQLRWSRGTVPPQPQVRYCCETCDHTHRHQNQRQWRLQRQRWWRRRRWRRQPPRAITIVGHAEGPRLWSSPQ